MDQTQKTWRKHWKDFWESQRQSQFEMFGNGLGLIAGAALAAPARPLIVGFLLGLFGMVGMNLWSGRFPYRRPIAAFFAGVALMMVITSTGHNQSVDPSVINTSILVAFIAANFSVIFANIGKLIASNVQRGLETLAWGMVVSLMLVLGYAWLRPNIPWFVPMVVQWLCVVILHAGSARAGGWKPNWPYISDALAPTAHRLETQ